MSMTGFLWESNRASRGGFDSKAHKVFNTFGGSFSGPLVIPHVYQGKDKTFFFADSWGFATPDRISVSVLVSCVQSVNVSFK